MSAIELSGKSTYIYATGPSKKQTMDSDHNNKNKSNSSRASPVKLDLKPREILELALWLEKTGVEFYRMLSEDEKLTEDVRGLFLRLMGMEMEHERLVREWLSEAPPGEHRKLAFDESLTQREYFVHLRALVERRVFPQGFNFLADLDSYQAARDAMPMAINIEQEAIILYQTLAGFQLPYPTQGTVQKIIKEEEDHIKEIKEILAELSS